MSRSNQPNQEAPAQEVSLLVYEASLGNAEVVNDAILRILLENQGGDLVALISQLTDRDVQNSLDRETAALIATVFPGLREPVIQNFNQRNPQNPLNRDFIRMMDSLISLDFLAAQGINERIHESDVSVFIAMMGAVLGNHLKIVQLLLDRGVSPDISNPEGHNALIFAAAQGRTRIVELLLDQGADIDLADQSGFNPLIAAVTQGQREVVNLLINRGASLEVTYRNQQGIQKSVLDIAREMAAEERFEGGIRESIFEKIESEVSLRNAGAVLGDFPPQAEEQNPQIPEGPFGPINEGDPAEDPRIPSEETKGESQNPSSRPNTPRRGQGPQANQRDGGRGQRS
ncbi:MAG: ankyrin repeat domain-containing protein [Proteobacteria bacterium]|nr:ankyrin repeat domain-containing protein [Pseudomonadota bacterium]